MKCKAGNHHRSNPAFTCLSERREQVPSHSREGPAAGTEWGRLYIRNLLGCFPDNAPRQTQRTVNVAALRVDGESHDQKGAFGSGDLCSNFRTSREPL